MVDETTIQIALTSRVDFLENFLNDVDRYLDRGMGNIEKGSLAHYQIKIILGRKLEENQEIENAG